MTDPFQCPACGADVAGSPNFCPSCGGSLQEPGPTGEAKLSGLRVGGFILGEPIRTGAVGEIYLAKHESLGKQVVIKLIHPQLLGDPNTSRRFRREALAASRLNHPNVIHVLDFGQLQNGRL
ncbi:MAG: serine/threonine protein kinase, partial [Myxococcota bacterium]|nr:serine/threonine protein kinase [Myxococcota bacterium]